MLETTIMHSTNKEDMMDIKFRRNNKNHKWCHEGHTILYVESELQTMSYKIKYNSTTKSTHSVVYTTSTKCLIKLYFHTSITYMLQYKW